MKPGKTVELTIEKLVLGGQGIARQGEKTFLVWNVLPGETVTAHILKKHRSIYECLATEIKTPSPERIEPQEAHFLSCSPWQILSLAGELHWKKKMALEAYRQIGKLEIESLEIESEKQAYGYRNKMEYSFASKQGALSLAFFQRGTHWKSAVSPCQLALPSLNDGALSILEWIKAQKFPESCLKNLVVRADAQCHTVGALLLNEELGIKSNPPLNDNLQGFEIYYSNPKTPAAVPHRKIHSAGNMNLYWTLRSARFEFGPFSFFQINPPIFEKTLEAIGNFLAPGVKIVDFYGGVGAIGLSLHGLYSSCLIVDSSQEAITCAKRNIELNGFSDCQAVASVAEKMVQAIEKDAVIILDPPRAGLHEKVIQKILSEKPPRIVYLSCNPATHARDMGLLSTGYDLKHLKLYNFFPRTPHIEALAILDRK